MAKDPQQSVETTHRQKKLSINHGKCIQCMECVSSCPEQAIRLAPNPACAKCVRYCITIDTPCDPEILVIDHYLCTRCGICIAVCPRDAIS